MQGGLFDDLREASLNDLLKIDFDGIAVGGLAVGETQKEMFKVLDFLKRSKSKLIPNLRKDSSSLKSPRMILLRNFSTSLRLPREILMQTWIMWTYTEHLLRQLKK